MRKFSRYITDRTIYALMKWWWYPLCTTPKRCVGFLECSLKQESAGRHVALSIYRCTLNVKVWSISRQSCFIWFCLYERTDRTIYVLMKWWWYPLCTTPKRFVGSLECSLKQESAGRHVAPYWYISLIPSQPCSYSFQHIFVSSI
jgi:hypothetical protein